MRIVDRARRECADVRMTDVTAARWEHFPHGADIGVRGYGATMAQAFEQAALAMMAAAVEPGTVKPAAVIDLDCAAPDAELLLNAWLNAIVYEIATRGMLFARFEVAIDGDRLEGRAWGEPLDRKRHDLIVEVKGATLTGLRVAQDDDGWIAQCVVDV
jgi:protein archease